MTAELVIHWILTCGPLSRKKQSGLCFGRCCGGHTEGLGKKYNSDETAIICYAGEEVKRQEVICRNENVTNKEKWR